MTRTEREAEARRLRDEGLLLREIAERMGVAVSTASDYLCDPGGARQRARKDSYRGTCDACGGATDGSSGPGRAPDLCKACRTWTDEEMVAAMRSWAEAHGGVPPTCTEWRSADVDHPSARTFGKNGHLGWNEALLRAGFALRCDRRPETQRWIEDEIRGGTRVADIARTLGISEAGVYHRIFIRGMSVREMRREAAA